MSAASLALEVAALTDGERALQILVEERSASLWSWIYWRFWKDSGTLRTSSHSEGSLEAEVWVLDRAPCESCCEVSQVVKGIRQSVTKRRIFGAKRKTLRGVTNYLYRNRLRMRYDEYLAKGRPIASGPVESACKNLLKDRMERSGIGWTETIAEAILQLRAVT